MATRAPESVGVDLIFLLKHASHVLSTEMTARLAELDITPRTYCVLAKAAEQDLTQSQLAQHTLLDKTTMVVTLDELERAGLAERRPSSTDRRARIVAVTDEGRRIVASAQQVVADLYDDVLAALPAGEKDAFVDGLVRLVGGRLSTPAACQRTPQRRGSSAL